jgi:replicative DNA helicase
MNDIVSISWDDDLGLFYSDMLQFDQTFDLLSKNELRIPTGIIPLDEKIGGGVIKKCLLVLVGESGIGKTLFLSNLAMNAVKSGKTVVYITFEIPRDQIFLRYTSAFSDIPIRTLIEHREEAKRRVKELYDSGKAGQFIIQEYPPGSFSALDVDNYLRELHLKKKITPDLIVIDYLGIMRPINTDMKNSYERGKEVCENLRWLSYKYNCPVYSASQTVRSAYGQERVGKDDVSDSLGITMTADLMIGISRPPEFGDLPQLRGEIIKSRLSEEGASFIIPVDKQKLKLLNESIDSTEEQKTVKMIQEIEKKKGKPNRDDDDDDNGVVKSSSSSEEGRNTRGIKIK